MVYDGLKFLLELSHLTKDVTRAEKAVQRGLPDTRFG
jgi:hypothetical protein